MEEPYALLSVPKPLGAGRTTPFLTPVTQYSGERSKQRPEVTVAVDGEGLYTYDVGQPHLITSQALSPQTRFLHPPLSIVWRRNDGTRVRVVAALTATDESGRRRIAVHREPLHTSRSKHTTQESFATSYHLLAEDDSDVVDMCIRPTKSESDNIALSFQFLIIFKDGRVRCLSGDAETVLWEARWPAGEDDESWIEHAHFTSSDLPERSTTGAQSNLLHENLILVRAARHKGVFTRSVYILETFQSMSDTQEALPGSRIASVRKIADLSRPTIRAKRWEAPLSLKSSHGAYFTLVGQALLRWTHDPSSAQMPFGMIRNIFAYTTLSSTKTLCALGAERDLKVYDFQWDTFHGDTQEITAIRASLDPNRKGPVSLRNSHFDISCFINKSAAAIISIPGQLFACSVGSILPTSKRRKLHGSCLADNIGRGRTESEGIELSDFRRKIHDLVEARTNHDLDEFMAKELSIPYTRTPNVVDDQVPLESGEGGVIAQGEENVEWTWPSDISELLRKTDRARAAVVFDEITSKDHVDDLQLRCFPESTVHWLALVGQLASQSKGKLMTALARYDSTLATMGIVLGWDFFLGLTEVVHALDLVISSLDSPIGQDDETAQITDGAVDDDDRSVNDASAAAENDLAFALASLNYGTAVRGGLLRSISDRLHAFPSEHIVQTFKAVLTPRKIVFLINLLRIELADGGWTTRYIDEMYESEEEDGPSDSSIGIIIKLLNASVDAIGPTGWNVGLSSDKQLNTDEMILVLRAEVSAALDGCQDYQSLGSSLQEFTKFCTEVGPVNRAAAKSLKRKAIDPIRNPGFLRDDVEDSLLPMGSRLDRIETTRTSKGGVVQQKSKGAIGQELSMLVGRYSLDRIRV